MSNATHVTPAGEGEPLERPPRRSTVVVGIVLAGLLFAAMAALLLYRAIAHPEPQQVAIVEGSERWLDASVIVTDVNSGQQYGALIDRTDRYSVPFFVPPGEYSLEVRVDDAPVYRQTFSLAEGDEKHIPLPREVPPATSPATNSSGD